MFMHRLVAVGLIASTAVGAYAGNEGYRGPAAPCGAGGTVWEKAAPNTNASWLIRVTGIGGPKDVIHEFVGTGTTNPGGWAAFHIEGMYGDRAACDVSNRAIMTPGPAPGGGPGGGQWPVNPPPPGVNPMPNPNPVPPVGPGFGVGAVSWLDIESLTVDPDTLLFDYEGIWWRLILAIGRNSAVNIPDLFADTNGDGVIGDGDILYSFVDLFIFLQAPPIFSLGDSFTIVDGVVTELPGMWFSSTPIFLDPVLGPQPSGGAWFSSNVGALSAGANAVVLSAHTLETPIPEPAAWMMMIAGFGLVGSAARRRVCALQA